MPEDPFLLGALAAVLILSAAIDYRCRKIPNLVTYPTMAVAIGYHSVTSGGHGVWVSLAGLATGIALLVLPYVLGGMGAGDAKLMGAVGAAIGPKAVCIAFLYSAVLGGIWALLMILVMRQRFAQVIERRWMEFKLWVLTRRYEPVPAPPDEASPPRLPYGVVIAMGTILSMMVGPGGGRW